MAVYTNVSQEALTAFLEAYEIGVPVRLTGILQGIENSNFILETTQGRFVLTVFERRAAAEDLPYFLGLMAHLAAKGFPSPAPIPMKDGQIISAIADKPTAIVSFLDGDWPKAPSPADAAEAGAGLARLHLAAADFGMERPNALGTKAWSGLFAECEGADTVAEGLAREIEGHLARILAAWPEGLPTGAIHADMFPDNLFLRNGTLSGVIDFYFACNDAYAYDLAITLNAWCFDADNLWQKGHAEALMAGYERVRALSPTEQAAMPILLQGAAMRFLLTRLYDWLHPRADALATQKDPLQQLAQLRFHQDQNHDG